METYALLKIIWVALLGILFIALGTMVGMDMGVGTLLRFVGRNDAERRTALNIIGPHWDGNQVWFILGGGAIFAAFPTLYGTSFSVFYVVMILLLFSMILRPVAFEYRSKIDNKYWRSSWDVTFLISGTIPMFIFGAAFGNILQGVGYHFLWTGQYVQDESFLSYLLNPFAILCGLLSVSLSIQQGAAMLMIRGEEPIYSRARRYGSKAGLIAALLFCIGGFWINWIAGFKLVHLDNPAMPANPLHGQIVEQATGAWLNNYFAHPLLWIIPFVGFISMLCTSLALSKNKPFLGWWLGFASWSGTILTVGSAMFPFLMPSTTAPNQSLTAWNATGSMYGLICMLTVALIFVPIIISYTAWCFRIMNKRVTIKDVIDNHESY